MEFVGDTFCAILVNVDLSAGSFYGSFWFKVIYTDISSILSYEIYKTFTDYTTTLPSDS